MPTYRLTHRAEINLAEIWWYVATDSPINADRLLDRLYDAFALLADFPEMSQEWSPETAPGVRRFPIGNYVIFHRPTEYGVLVLRILHGKRDLRRLLQDIE